MMQTKKEKKMCEFCVNQKNVDYKDVEVLHTYLNAYKSIAPRRRTGACAWHQRKISAAIKQSRIMGLLPFIHQGH